MPANASVTKSSRTERIRHPAVESFDLATVMRALGDPVRIEMVRIVDGEGEILCTEIYDRLGLPASTGSYHLRQLREAGVTRARAVGPKRMTSLRREDLDSRFPGLLDVVIAAG
jgi:DNA-binding transcriptional ArsR family regulator